MVLLDNLLPPDTNVNILDHLATCEWRLSRDNLSESKLLTALNNNSGLQNITYQDGKYCGDRILNIYGHLILDLVSYKLGLRTYPYRFFWNCYLTPSFSKEHRDWPKPNKYKTIIYNLHTTDGGTEVDGKFYEDKMGQAKIFESNLLHKGISCNYDNVRFNLNIMFGDRNEK